MYYLCFPVIIAICMVYIMCDVNYILRTLFTVYSGRLYQTSYSICDVTTIYGICTLQDCDIGFKCIRIARLIREIDFARYHFYDRTGIYQRSIHFGIKSLQGSTFVVSAEPVALFVPYKINTKLVYWDERSLFFEHEVVTVHDSRLRCLLVSRQYGIGNCKQTMAILLKGLPGSEQCLICPEYLKIWLQSQYSSSLKLRNIHLNDYAYNYTKVDN